jgi:hypothetical protein
MGDSEQAALVKSNLYSFHHDDDNHSEQYKEQ